MSVDLCPICGDPFTSAGVCRLLDAKSRETHQVRALESIAASLLKLAPVDYAKEAQPRDAGGIPQAMQAG
jgi:hypothetical protein